MDRLSTLLTFAFGNNKASPILRHMDISPYTQFSEVTPTITKFKQAYKKESCTKNVYCVVRSFFIGSFRLLSEIKFVASNNYDRTWSMLRKSSRDKSGSEILHNLLPKSKRDDTGRFLDFIMHIYTDWWRLLNVRFEFLLEIAFWIMTHTRKLIIIWWAAANFFSDQAEAL